MAKRHVLMIGFEELAPQMERLLPKISGQLELVAVPDGARGVSAHAKLAAAGVPPLVVIVRSGLEFVDGPQVAQTVRAAERAIGVAASALLYVSGEDGSEAVDTLIAGVGRAVHLKLQAEQPHAHTAQRLAKATAKILEQLRKRGKA
jgi:hypothetical protein